MRICLVAALEVHCGNETTTSRIRSGLEGLGHACFSFANDDPSSTTAMFTELLQVNQVDCLVAIHALRSSTLLKDCRVPFIVVFGGTDVNENAKNTMFLEEMRAVLCSAKRIVSFTESMKIKAETYWPDLSSKIVVLRQGVVVEPDGQTRLRDFLPIHHASLSVKEPKYFILAAGLRPVKDVLFLVSEFSRFHEQRPDVFLIIIGARLDVDYASFVDLTLKNHEQAVTVLASVSRPNFHSILVHDAFALVNSSVSEGMCGSILEAMTLKVPVIARRNDGNAAVIQHNINGLLFDSPQDFVAQSTALLQDSNLRQILCDSASQSDFSVHDEAVAYQSLLVDALNC